MSPVFPCTNASLAVTPASTEVWSCPPPRCQTSSRNKVPSMRWPLPCASTLGFTRRPQVLFCALLSDLSRRCGVACGKSTGAESHRLPVYGLVGCLVAAVRLRPQHAEPPPPHNGSSQQRCSQPTPSKRSDFPSGGAQ